LAGKADRQVYMRWYLAKEDTYGGCEGRFRVFVSDQVGVQLREGEQVIGVARSNADDALPRLHQSLDEFGLRLVQVGIDGYCDDDIRFPSGLQDLLVFGICRLRGERDAAYLLVALLDALDKELLWERSARHSRKDA